MPGVEGVGKEAFRWARTIGFRGERRSRPRSSRSGASEGTDVSGGARKMVFSTLAWAIVARREVMRARARRWNWSWGKPMLGMFLRARRPVGLVGGGLLRLSYVHSGSWIHAVTMCGGGCCCWAEIYILAGM